MKFKHLSPIIITAICISCFAVLVMVLTMVIVR